MSLLEDVFLEDEAGEAQELERVIEGDEYDERPLSPNSDDNEEKEGEAEEDKRRVDPNETKAKRVVKNPRFILNPARLTGPRGIQVIPDHYKDFKFKGKGHEKEDLDMVLKKLEHWAYRLYPKFGFHDCLKKIETLGKKRTVMVHLQKIRSDQLVSEEAVVQKDSSDEETEAPVQDEFDKLLQQQIELARSTPAPGSGKKPGFGTPAVDRSLMMPKATSSPSISEEQRERMLRNRRLAEERKFAKLRNESAEALTPKDNTEVTVEPEVTNVIDEVVVRKLNRSNVIDSSDDEEPIVNRSIAVDIHSAVEMDDVFNENETSNQNNIEVISESDVTKEVFAQKRNKSNVIDSSDEDEPVASDVHDHEMDNTIENRKQNNLGVVSEFDITKEVNAQKRNKSNVIDSSDKDEHVNKSVAVDIEDKVDNEVNDNALSDRNDIHKFGTTPAIREIIDEEVVRNREKSNVIEDEEIVRDQVDEINGVVNDKNKDNTTSTDIRPDTTNDTQDSTHLITDKVSENLSDVNTPENIDTDVNLKTVNNDSKLNAGETNKEHVEILDEVMDIDFSDDF